MDKTGFCSLKKSTLSTHIDKVYTTIQTAGCSYSCWVPWLRLCGLSRPDCLGGVAELPSSDLSTDDLSKLQTLIWRLEFGALQNEFKFVQSD